MNMDTPVSTPGYTLSPNQENFVRACKRRGYEVFYTYSGRCMYGHRCPAAIVPRFETFKPRCRVSWDNMGLDMVVYAPE